MTSFPKNLVAFGNIPVSVGPHRSNTMRGVISYDDLLELSESELLQGWRDQDVEEVQIIMIRRDDRQIPALNTSPLLSGSATYHNTSKSPIVIFVPDHIFPIPIDVLSVSALYM